MNRYYITAQFLQCLYGSVIRSSLRTVYHDLHSGQIHLYRLNGMIDILLSGIRTVLDFSYVSANREFDSIHIIFDQYFNFIFQCVRKLIPISIKKFNPVKLNRVVGCGNDNTCIYLILSCKISYRWCWDHTNINMPAIRAFASISPEIRVSHPTIIVGLCSFSFVST